MGQALMPEEFLSLIRPLGLAGEVLFTGIFDEQDSSLAARYESESKLKYASESNWRLLLAGLCRQCGAGSARKADEPPFCATLSQVDRYGLVHSAE
jgi:hypothetical protein